MRQPLPTPRYLESWKGADMVWSSGTLTRLTIVPRAHPHERLGRRQQACG